MRVLRALAPVVLFLVVVLLVYALAYLSLSLLTEAVPAMERLFTEGER